MIPSIQGITDSLHQVEQVMQQVAETANAEIFLLQTNLGEASRAIEVQRAELERLRVSEAQLQAQRNRHIKVSEQMRQELASQQAALREAGQQLEQNDITIRNLRDGSAQLDTLLTRLRSENSLTLQENSGLRDELEATRTQLRSTEAQATATNATLVETQDQLRTFKEAQDDFIEDLVTYAIRATMMEAGVYPTEEQTERLRNTVLSNAEVIRNITLQKGINR